MNFTLTEQQLGLRDEVRRVIQERLSPELLEETYWRRDWGPKAREFLANFGSRGWLTPTWPRKYGGIESTHTEKLIIDEEMAYYRVRPSLVGARMGGPTILKFGSEQQKDYWLPALASGKIEFALGYTEPQAGSDLAALDIRAVEDGDDYVISGVKLFNTACHYADYHWLGARTDPDLPKHRGVSLFIVDLKSPGITVRPLWTMSGYRTNEVHYDNVRVPKTNLVGQRGRGFHQIAVALDFERMMPVGGLQRLLDDLLREVGQVGTLTRDHVFQRQVAEIATEVDICRLLAMRIAWMLDRGTIPNHESSMLKLFYSETQGRLTQLGVHWLGPFGQLKRGSKWAKLDGAVEFENNCSILTTIVAGTSEVMRNVIAQRGLGLPRC